MIRTRKLRRADGPPDQMFLVDSSVWINHFRAPSPDLVTALTRNTVYTHPHIIGEIALGSLKNRRTVLQEFYRLPQTRPASDSEVHQMIEKRVLYSRGIGYIDAHLLASVLIEGDIRLWTADKRLADIASDLGIGVGV